MLNLFNKPILKDEDKSSQAQVVHMLLIGAMLVIIVLEIIQYILLPQHALRWLIIFLLYNSVSFALLALNRKGYPELVSVIFISFLSILLFVLAWTAGGIWSNAMRLIVVVVLAVGLLFNWKNGVIYSICVIFAALALVIAENMGFLPTNTIEQNPIRMWINFSILIALLTLFQYIIVSNLEKTVKELKESKERFETLSSIATEGLMIHENGIILDLNLTFAQLLGYSTTHELIGKNGLETISFTPESKEIVYEHFNSKSDETFDVEILTLSGKLIPVETRGTEIMYKGHKANLVYMRDISDRKTAENALRESQKLFETLSHMSPVGIFRTRADGYTTYVNPKWSELSGISFEEALGDGWLKAVHPDDREILAKKWKLHSSKGEKSTAEYRFLKQDGNIVWVLGDTNPQIIDNKIKGYIGTLTNITELKLAEKAIKESEERYKNLIEAFPDIIMVSDFDGHIIFANKPFERLTGILPSDYNNLNRKAHIHPDDRSMVLTTLKDLIKGNKNYTDVFENRFIDSWGKMHWFSGIMSKITFEGKSLIQTVSRDISEKKAIESELEKYRKHLEILVKERTEELAASNEELNASNEELYHRQKELQASLKKLSETQERLVQSEKMASLGILSAGIAHEINNPLNFIHGGITSIDMFMKEHKEEYTERIKSLIEAVNTGVTRISDIVSSLNHYSRKDDLQLIDCNIHSIIDNCLIMLQSKLKNKVEVIKNFTKEPFYLTGNEGKLHQAILNIISNAEQSIEGKGFIEINTQISKNQLNIEITDSGNGISSKNISKIFDPFFTTKDPGKGTGLGLAITYNIITEHNGTIKFNSELGKGTKVKIQFPN